MGFVNLGCPKNLVDSEIMADELRSAGIPLAPSPEAADVVIVNTCAFIQKARQESVDAILDACRLKAGGACRAVLVAGCLPQRYQRNLARSLPEVDAFIGLDELDRVGAMVRRLAAGARGLYAVGPRARRLFAPRRPGILFTGGPYAYLRIAEGCNHRCAFCAIPHIRGPRRCRPLRAVVREAEHWLERGVSELNLIAQDTTAYGLDLRDGGTLPQLLRELGRIGGRFWIRLLYAYPTRITDALIEAMASVPQVCPYLDVPIQHSDPAILRAMRRGNTVRAVHSLPVRLRAALPDVVLRTTCLVGFPGEREAHFRRLLDFVREAEFDHLGAFTFSAEEGTPAARLPERPAAAVAAERRRRLMLAQQAVVARKAARLIGTEAEVLLERPVGAGARVWRARSRRQAPEIDGEVLVRRLSGRPAPGAFVRIRYTAPAGYDMLAVAAGRR